MPRQLSDSFLRGILNLTDKRHMDMDIALAVRGLTVSGRLIDARRYFEQSGRFFDDALKNKSSEIREEVKGAFDFWLEHFPMPNAMSDEDKQGDSHFVHLEDVRILQAGSHVYSTSLWRGRFDAIDGFSLGLPKKMK